MPDTDVMPYGTATAAVREHDPDGLSNPSWYADADAGRYRTPDLMLSDKMPSLVKGVGYCKPGGNKPLDDEDQVFRRSMKAEIAFRKAIKDGIERPAEVLKGLSPDFAGQFGAFMQAAPGSQGLKTIVEQLNTQLSDIMGKSITLTSPLTSGFVPFDLVSPSSLIYPAL